ncbi:hypothetical protein K9B35_01630 [Sphingomonas sp. R647]|nr:hypothetical protein [Sphingomonas sp. R647]MCA1196656.1 hypothetical protein [Sphingomonas sp. R647]
MTMNTHEDAKLPFEPSELVEHGDVNTLTENRLSGGAPGDGNGGGAGYS